MNKVSYGLRARDYAGSAAGFLTVLGILVIMDQRVSFKIAQLISRGPAGEIGPLAKWVSELGSALMARAEGSEHRSRADAGLHRGRDPARGIHGEDVVGAARPGARA